MHHRYPALLLACLAGLAAAVPGLAQQLSTPPPSTSPSTSQRPAPAGGGLRAWCEQHRADCDQLRSLRQQAEQSCGTQGKDSESCQQAHQALHQLIDKMRAEGAPPPPAGRHMPPPAGTPPSAAPAG